MKEQGIIDLGDLRIISYQANPENSVHSNKDFLDLDNKIGRRLSFYNLQSFLIKIHDTFLEHEELNQLLPSNV